MQTPLFNTAAAAVAAAVAAAAVAAAAYPIVGLRGWQGPR